MLLQWPAKAPEEDLDYRMEWAKRLDGDTIQSVTWQVPAGLQKTNESNDQTSATIWLAGGDTGRCYNVRCMVTTAAGRVMVRTASLKIVGK